jgi:ABC-type Fe3+-siderophore transport system permease subunit
VKDGKYKMLAAASGAAFITLVCSLLLLVPEDIILPGVAVHGMNGAAISMLAASIVAFAGYRICTARTIDCRPHRSILTHLLCAGVMVASLKFVAWYFSLSFTWYWIIVFAFLGALIYGISLYLVGEFIEEDYKRFMRLTGDAG